MTKVEQAERWIRAADEDAAAQKVKDELVSPWAYAGKWEIKATQVEVVETQPNVPGFQQESSSESSAMLLDLTAAASELGIPHRTLYELTKRGDIEYTKVGGRKYISRESLAAFIQANTHR
ncbi:helix-turn-helix domain-containing protein [Microbacterium sp. CFBP9034]|uniref:helix-turn-helix domain-containing protein n=1 Tax=Microbacterium sp. CFBP9034 TaxID=3096540 RepID=UPI002A6B0AC0|nr:helix-turn-helix domain-containing protein [Microbacterium sp. CFBP9034]MDY0910114.1 helix-turn-helix domain-containing protein [Microbacterium sp. CFBP9034]